MKVKGIIQGKTIQLSEEVSVPDGTEVMVEIPDHPKMSEEQRREKLKQFSAIPHQDTEELVAVLTELEKERNEKIRGELNTL
ncbi:MAG: hypothetical protein KME09_26515 [Pleurocapsa minor HA4230-MV1]|jgi:predicted HAD superfamily phosphohydrolase|nr:hypothetical protein [Pleurocapsa minor HA4230-MV1]